MYTRFLCDGGVAEIDQELASAIAERPLRREQENLLKDEPGLGPVSRVLLLAALHRNEQPEPSPASHAGGRGAREPRQRRLQRQTAYLGRDAPACEKCSTWQRSAPASTTP